MGRRKMGVWDWTKRKRFSDSDGPLADPMHRHAGPTLPLLHDHLYYRV